MYRITEQIPQFMDKYGSLTNKALFWELFKMEIRVSTIAFAKTKAKQKRNEEKQLLKELNRLQDEIKLR